MKSYNNSIGIYYKRIFFKQEDSDRLYHRKRAKEIRSSRLGRRHTD
ncbi:MAG TPA: hypothetical protein VE548_04680 [Nitrososphaeraceae archaeon]|nr:hypothetical protein [Nitrososphaeraceae archaeon]